MNLSAIKCFLLDLDGTVYISSRLIEGAKDAVKRMRRLGRVLFLTNNSSLSRSDYLKKLNSLGLDATENEIYTSGLAAVNYLKSSPLHKNANVFLVGTNSLRSEFLGQWINLCESNADTVVVAFDTELTYQKLLTACRLIKKGARYIATHPDLTCPHADGNMPDAGSFIALIKAATGREPDVVCGKPFKPMADGIISLLDCAPNEIVMMGDRLSTDIKFAVDFGFNSALVLSGEATLADYKNSGLKADLVLESIAFFDK